MKQKLRILAGSLVIVYVAAAIGSLATAANIESWYSELVKPTFSPPNWVFGPVWTVLYALMGISLYLVWIAKTPRTKRWVFTAFGVQLVLNTLWSLVFFGGHSLWGGVGIIGALLVMIVVTIVLFGKISRVAAVLLVPYLAWVSFATALNVGVALVNPANSVQSYEECTKQSGSHTLLSYPAVCVYNGQQFLQPAPGSVTIEP